MKKLVKDLETIVKIQERTIEAEKIVSNRLFEKWFDQEQIITDWRYSYWKLERRFSEALRNIKFLNHYIKQKEIKKGKYAKKKK